MQDRARWALDFLYDHVGAWKSAPTENMIKLPGLIDPHVHLREPGATHKEDYDSGTSAALAGGITIVLAMPNTKPPIFDADTLDLALNAAKQKAHCDYGQFVGAGPDNAGWDKTQPQRAAGLENVSRFNLWRTAAG